MFNLTLCVLEINSTIEDIKSVGQIPPNREHGECFLQRLIFEKGSLLHSSECLRSGRFTVKLRTSSDLNKI